VADDWRYEGTCPNCGADTACQVEGEYFPGSLIDPPEYPAVFITMRACDEDCTATNERIEDIALEAYYDDYPDVDFDSCEPSYDAQGWNLPYGS